MKVKIIKITATGSMFDNLLPGTVHEVVDPPKENRKKFPNNEDSVWVMGVSEPVRIFTSGRGKEGFILSDDTDKDG